MTSFAFGTLLRVQSRNNGLVGYADTIVMFAVVAAELLILFAVVGVIARVVGAKVGHVGVWDTVDVRHSCRFGRERERRRVRDRMMYE